MITNEELAEYIVRNNMYDDTITQLCKDITEALDQKQKVIDVLREALEEYSQPMPCSNVVASFALARADELEKTNG